MCLYRKALLLLILCLFSTSQSDANVESQGPVFHDIRVNTIDSYIDLVEPADPAIVKVAEKFTTYDEAYDFVANKIKFVPYVPPGPVRETLRHGVGSCLGKAVLLCSIYRAMGLPKENIRIVVGIVVTEQGLSDHVWIDMEVDGRCLQQDPSGMLGNFDFYAFPDNRYVDKFVMKEIFCFNEQHLAIVSQLNRMRHSANR